MNGLEMLAESYRHLVERGELTEEEVKPDLKVLDFIATCTQDELYRMVDTSAFNDIIKSFCRTALKNAKVTEEVEDTVMNELRWLFDEKKAKEVCEG
jgi:hypothetical protein